MLTNPYSTSVNSSNDSGAKLQCDVHPGDKALIMSLKPSKGTIQLVVNNLIKNLCDDIRELNITGWQPDGDDILSILVERRAFNETQCERLRHTSICASGTVPSRLLNSRRGTSVREKAPKSKVVSPNSQKRTPRRVERVRETSSPQIETQSEQNPTES